jgi:hypothetical protein
MEVLEQLRSLKLIPQEARVMLDKELEERMTFHTEKCCSLNLNPQESSNHKEARALAKNLIGFFSKKETQLATELQKLTKELENGRSTNTH